MKDIILGLFFIGLITACVENKYVDTFAKNNNIYVTKSDGKIKQVTYLGKDKKPLISPQEQTVFFIRETGDMGEDVYEGTEQLAIMQVDVKSLKEEKLTDTIHYEDWNSTSNIYEVTGFTISQDGNYIFFITQKWTTSGVLVKLNTHTKKMTEISHGDKFELLIDGQYQNHIIVTRSSIKRNAGRQWTNWLIDMDGKEIKEIGDDEAVVNFKRKQNLKTSH